jgi:c-di-GMP-binding flagellar brake protein YcgR
VPRKPLVIVLVAACFLLSPALIVLQASIFTLTPVIGPYNIFAKLSVHDLVILALYPVCAAAVFFVRRWGWYVYVSAVACLVADNVVVFLLRPQYHLIALVGYDLVLAVAAGIFFRRSVIAPYFNPGLRWWEQPARFGLGIYLSIAGRDGRTIQADIVDISETGAFAVCLEGLPADAELAVELHALGHRILTRARVRRRVPHNGTIGYGLQFARPDRVQAIALRALLRDFRRAGLLKRARERPGMPVRTAPRFLVNAGAEIAAGDRTAPAVLLDLSRTGCLLGLPGGPETGPAAGFRVAFRCFGGSVSVACEPRWTGRLEGAPVCGAAFRYESAAQKKRVRRIIARLRRAGAADRRKTARPVPKETLAELALKSPYRLLDGVRRIFVNKR